MKLTVHRGKRIPTLFILGIGIPCLLLGYLAFRGIQNDQALIEKERLNEHRKILELITGSVEEKIFTTEQAFLIVISKYQEIGLPGLIRSIDSLKNQYPLVEEFFNSGNSGEIDFPAAQFLYLTDGSMQLFSSLRSTASVRKALEGQQSEFQQKDYLNALVSYREEFDRAYDLQTKGELLNAIGRVQKKSTLFLDAQKTYGAIVLDYNQVKTAGGVPLGLAARLELCSLSMALNDTLTAVKTFMNLYKDLLNREWTLEKAQYDFFSKQIKTSVDGIFSLTPSNSSYKTYRSAFTLLKEKENYQIKNTERLLAFRGNAAADLKAEILLNPEELQRSYRRFTLETGGHIHLVSVLGKYQDTGSRLNEIPGLLLNTDYLRDTLLRQALQQNVRSKKTGWVVKGRDDKVILKSEDPPSGSVTAISKFIGGFPPWSVELYQQEPDLFESFLFSRRGIYFFMFFLLAGILIFGLTLTIHTVAHELELSKMKSDFVSTISHEFKSPLSSIRQLSEMLQSGRIPSEEYRQKYYDVLVEQSERLSLLIDNILDFSKIEEGKKEFDFGMVDIGLLLQETLSTIQDQVRHKNFIIKHKIEERLPLVKADKASIVQMVANLTDNAIKYSGNSREILVRVFTENQYLVIEVRDFGIGIRKEEFDKVFERFYRGGDVLTRKVKGSGLGLTLVKQIVDVHHGKISVESEVGKGSRFTVSIPVNRN